MAAKMVLPPTILNLNADSCSDPGTVQWDLEVPSLDIQDTKTIIQDSEKHRDVEFSLTVDEGESINDDVGIDPEKENAVTSKRYPEIDDWKDFDEMVTPPSQMTLLN